MNARCPASPRRAPASPHPTTLVLPILMYHHLQPVAASATALLRGLTVTPTEFEAQAEYLERHRYHTITFAELVAYLNDRAGLPENPIILTFDDGWREDYTVAFPVLQKHCLTGTFFPPIKWIGQTATVLTWDEIMEMSAGGMEFGSHTLNHHLLANQTADEIHEQLRGSKAILEARLGKPVVALAYPANSFNALVESIAEDEGYGVALTTNAGIYQNTNELFSLHRTAIRFVDTLEAFASKISVPPVASGRLR
jgi:peptidoglycan/xylan/chitin deacetylase (PgdA/CDA1 family)